MIRRKPIESTHTEAERLLAADVEATADLPNENTTDWTPTNANDRPYATDSAALQEGEATATVDWKSSPANAANTAHLLTIEDQPLAPIPTQRALGFFSFTVCALIAILFTTQWDTESSHLKTEAILAVTSLTDEVQLLRIPARGITDSREMEKPVETRTTQDTEVKRERAGARATLGVVSFESRSFVTSEKALAAVFIVKRTQAVRGRAQVQWAVHSGSADAGIDFSDASGTARFADGQRQLAIYVPLRNDLLGEQDETFKVCLRSPRHARIGVGSCAEATIRDDDNVSST